MGKLIPILGLLLIVGGAGLFFTHQPKPILPNPISSPASITQTQTDPLQISEMRKKSYPGSDLVIEQTLSDGSNYHPVFGLSPIGIVKRP